MQSLLLLVLFSAGVRSGKKWEKCYMTLSVQLFSSFASLLKFRSPRILSVACCAKKYRIFWYSKTENDRLSITSILATQWICSSWRLHVAAVSLLFLFLCFKITVNYHQEITRTHLFSVWTQSDLFSHIWFLGSFRIGHQLLRLQLHRRLTMLG